LHPAEILAGLPQGVHIVQVENSALPGEVEAGDLLKVDFDQHSIALDGLYCLARGSWSGIRRFAHTLTGLQINDGGTWRLVAPAELASVTVTGRVNAVYRSMGAFA
jgi:hypothetical protein